MPRSKKGNNEQEYFTWDYLMKKLDRNGELPSYFMALSSVRGPGKTYDLSRQMLKQFLGHDCELARLIGTRRQIGLLCRTKNVLGNYAAGVLGQVIKDKYPMSQIEEVVVGGSISEIYWIMNPEDKECMERHLLGYVLPLNSRGYIKNVSSSLTGIGVVFMDEMIAEKGDPYVPKEFDKFINILQSISRGEDLSPHKVEGEIRYLPVFMAGNAISQNNPYFERFGLCGQLQKDTILYRGEGIVYQRCDNLNAIKRQKKSRLMRAVKEEVSTTGFWDDNTSGICKPSSDWGRGVYECTLKNEGSKYGIVYYRECGIYYITDKIDDTCHNVYSLTVDGSPNVALLRSARYFKYLREAIFNGLVRFRTVGCRSILDKITV